MTLAWTLWHVLERLVALFLILLLLPVLLLFAVLIAIRGGRSPLLTHRRVGLHGEPFNMLKFRTMWGSEIPPFEPHVETKPQSDPRIVGGFAHFLRRFSIDELPQLIHAASGRMSLVGPRPLTTDELERHYGRYTEEVLSMRPGLTGLWQVLGRSRLSYPQRLRLDLFLVRHHSIRFHLWILFRTVRQVVTGRDAW